MKEEGTDITDFSRILLGKVPPEFYIELLIRLVIIYLLSLLAMRLLGKRMAAQLSRNELAALVSIAAAVGVSLQAPDRGLLPTLVIIIVIVLVGRCIAVRAYKNRKFEIVSQGKASVLVKDSVLQLKTMTKVRISKERVFAQLRSKELKNLGEVKRLYVEAGGVFSLVKQEHARPGLSLVPEWDHELRNEQKKAGDNNVCSACGYLPQVHLKRCPNCNANNWTEAIK
jgi:uncharacterized membrane protein YcaP (DUF421 family)